MAYVNYESRLYVQLHPFSQRNSVSIGHAVVYYARSAHAFSAEIECWHCK